MGNVSKKNNTYLPAQAQTFHPTTKLNFSFFRYYKNKPFSQKKKTTFIVL
jgi:hypothetical protein